MTSSSIIINDLASWPSLFILAALVLARSILIPPLLQVHLILLLRDGPAEVRKLEYMGNAVRHVCGYAGMQNTVEYVLTFEEVR